MCGIAGIVRWDGAPVDELALRRMAQEMTHRGPDDGDVTLVGAPEPGASDDGLRLGLAHRRLSIIDLSAGGRQPMRHGHLTITYNGEVYNYLELAQELRAAGHAFSTHSDTEVLLRAWAEWGEGALERLNGIFAFALWDSRRRVLYCVRDRLGVKPFYYAFVDGALVFASELKALLTGLPARPDVHEPAVHTFLTSGRLDHDESTFFAGVRRLPAGTLMRVEASGHDLRWYWHLPEETWAGTLDQAAEEFRSLFHDAIRQQMRADVTVGCCLSGGLDSSAVASVASRYNAGPPMKVFTARFEDRRMDEWSYAKAVHEEKRVEGYAVVAGPWDMWEHLDEVVRAQEEPFGGPGVYVQWRLMQEIARHGVKVVLDGQGGDELLCGYAKYFYFSVLDMVRGGQVTSALRALASLARAGRYLFNVAGARRYLPSRLWLERQQRVVLQPDFAARHQARAVAHPAGSVRRQQELDIQRFGLPALLRYEDKSSMAHSIESRVPFLDHRLVELAVRLPTAYKLQGARSKVVLRRGLAEDLPRRVLERRSKLGFGGYYDSWIAALDGPLSEWARARQRPVDRFVRPEALRAQLARRDVRLFRGLILDRWMRQLGYG